ncbi:ABC transporter substrate-binding protein [Flagellimonas sp. S174]|uniref:ABC transporter substrate-binding protein n=1 Tax=Flagellimonas sp. S174 TaxID=3410790 RepID=UPI003BF478F1
MEKLAFKDQMGRTVVLSQTPSRIVCLNPSQTETLVGLGLEDQIVGVTKFCVHPSHLRKVKKVVGGTKKVDFEVIQGLKPDIILCNKEENTKEIVETLEKEFPVHVTDIANLQDAFEMLQQYGQIFNCPVRANEMCTDIVSEKNKLEAILKGRPKKRVAYFIWKDPMMVVGKDTFIDAMLTLNGFENVFSSYGRYPTTSLEELKDLSLDMVLLSSEPFPFKEKHQKEFQELLMGVDIKLMDGEYFSWYGSRLLEAFQYFRSLHGH